MGAQRFAVEFVRFDTGQKTLFVLGTWTISVYQAVGLGLVLVGVGGAFFQKRRSAREALAA
jgi:prolipoprotein diacylglyceryltransferase